MTSTYTTRNRFNLQADGDNTNTWGDVLNAGVFGILDTALDGWTYLTPAGPVTLTTVNGAADQARSRGLKFQPGSIATTTTLPPLEKLYCVWNASTAAQTIASSGGGTSALIQPGELVWVASDGVNAQRSTLLSMGGAQLNNLANGAAAQDAVTFSQMNAAISSAAFSMGSFGVPIVPGNAGQFLTNNGSTASWVTMTTAQVSDYAADQAAKQAALKAFAIAAAIAL